MLLNPLSRSPSAQAVSPQVLQASVQRAPAPRGIGAVGETIARTATNVSRCSCFQRVINFFSWVRQSIVDVFRSILRLFMGGSREGTHASYDGYTGGPAMVIGADVPLIVYQGLTVDPSASKLAEAPVAFDPGVIQYTAQNIQPPVQNEEILAQFDGICVALGVAEDAIFYQDQGRPITRALARQSLLDHYVNFVRYSLIEASERMDPSDSFREYDRLAATDIDVILKGIIIELRNTAVPLDKKRLAIENLCSSARHCPPRRHTESMHIYRTLSNQPEGMKQIVQEYIQMIKETLFVNYYSLSSEPVMTLNYIRKTVGQQLGLDMNPVNLQDIYMSMHDARSPDNRLHKHTTEREFVGVFHQIYTPQNILFHMKNFINGRCVGDNEWANEQLGAFIYVELQDLEKKAVLTAEEVDNSINNQVYLEIKDGKTTITDWPARSGCCSLAEVEDNDGHAGKCDSGAAQTLGQEL